MKESTFVNVPLGARVEWETADGKLSGQVYDMKLHPDPRTGIFEPYVVINPDNTNRKMELAANANYLALMDFKVVAY